MGPMPGVRHKNRRKSGWERLPDEKLLDVRLCDLGVAIAGSSLEPHIQRVQHELSQRGIKIKPSFWLSDEWFTPLGITGIAIPFYLAHPRLKRLERARMLEVEGGSAKECMRILRHEMGHVVDNGWRLRRRRRRQQLFGKSSDPYPETYSPKPYSRSYVLHLNSWYAQSHPDEDFAETFATWLTPGLQWRKRYEGWRALKKLEYVDELMGEIAGTRAPVRDNEPIDSIDDLDKTLREHYEEKRERYAVEYPRFYDRDLQRLFGGDPDDPTAEPATKFIRRHRRDVGGKVSRWTGVYRYMIKLVLDDMIARSRELRLRLGASDEDTLSEFTVLLTVATMNFVQSGRHRIAL